MSIILAIHITTAISTLIICIYAWFRPTKSLETVLTVFSLISIITGIYSSLDQAITVAYCTKLGLYLASIIGTKYMLISYTKNKSISQTI